MATDKRPGGWLGAVRRALAPAPQEQKASAARPLIALQSLGAPAWTPRDYGSLAREGYQRNVIGYRCVRMIAEAAASVPFVVVEDGGVLTDHPLLSLLRAPNPEQPGAELMEAFYGFLQTAGNAYLEAARLGEDVRELYVLRPDRMKVRLGAAGWPDAYEYTVSGRTTQFQRDGSGFLPVLHLRLFHPTNDHYGMSPLEAAGGAVDIHNASAAWNKALLDNAARPSGALIYKGPDGAPNLTEEQFDRIKTELQQSYEGAENAGRPLLLEGGLDWKQMSLSPADMDFMDARNAAAREIALAFGVPPMLLGIPGDNTYSNYKEANLAFWKQTIAPLARKTATALGNWLGPQFSGARLKPDLEDVEALAADREQRWTRIGRAGFLTVNEKRAALGFPPVDGGDVLEG